MRFLSHSFLRIAYRMASVSKTLNVKPTVFVASQTPHLLEHLRSAVPPDIEFKYLELPDAHLELDVHWTMCTEHFEFLKDSEVLLCDPGILVKVYDRLQNLRWAHCTWAGVQNLIAKVNEKGVTPRCIVTRHGGTAFGMLMAEYVLCQILTWERGMHRLWKLQENCIWSEEERVKVFDSRSLDELVVCVLGIGNMGCNVARVLKSMGCRLIGFGRSPRKSGAEEYAYFDKISTDLTELLPECDYLCNTLPSTPSTSGLLDGEVLEKCTKRPVFINVGRGDIIQEKYLIEALKNEWISGASLDVFQEEPLPPSSLLWKMWPKVIITPHLAAPSKAAHVVEDFLENYGRFVECKKLKNVVDWVAGY